MEYRRLGASGLKVPVLSFGAGTFAGSGPLFGHWGTSDVTEARRLIDICLEAGVNLRLIQQYLGHSSLHTTMVYLHLTTVSQEQAVARIEALMGP